MQCGISDTLSVHSLSSRGDQLLTRASLSTVSEMSLLFAEREKECCFGNSSN